MEAIHTIPTPPPPKKSGQSLCCGEPEGSSESSEENGRDMDFCLQAGLVEELLTQLRRGTGRGETGPWSPQPQRLPFIISMCPTKTKASRCGRQLIEMALSGVWLGV